MGDVDLDLENLGALVAGAAGAKRYRILLVDGAAGVTAAALEKDPAFAGPAVILSAEVPDGGGKAELALAPRRAELDDKVKKLGDGARIASFVLGFPAAGTAGAKATTGPVFKPKKAAKKEPDRILKRDDPRLSAVRKQFLAELDRRLPSQDGVKAAPGKTNLFDGTQAQNNGTSCGLLPTVLLQYGMKLGIVNGKAGVFGYGTEGIRIDGRAMGVYVESDGTAMPLPGDIYTLRYGDDPNGDRVSHVGVIVDLDPKDGSTWVTGDSGQDQGKVRGAKYVNRAMRREDGVHPYLTGEYTTALRRLGGWVDLDKLMAKLGR